MWTWVLSLATVAGLVVVSTLYIFRPEVGVPASQVWAATGPHRLTNLHPSQVLYTANFAFHSARARLRRGQHTIIAPAGEAREDADAAAKAQEFSFSFLQRNAHEKVRVGWPVGWGSCGGETSVVCLRGIAADQRFC